MKNSYVHYNFQKRNSHMYHLYRTHNHSCTCSITDYFFFKHCLRAFQALLYTIYFYSMTDIGSHPKRMTFSKQAVKSPLNASKNLFLGGNFHIKFATYTYLKCFSNFKRVFKMLKTKGFDSIIAENELSTKHRSSARTKRNFWSFST